MIVSSWAIRLFLPLLQVEIGDVLHHRTVGEQVADDAPQEDAVLRHLRLTRRALQIQRQQPLQHLLIPEVARPAIPIQHRRIQLPVRQVGRWL
jgi:hypothetical protein